MAEHTPGPWVSGWNGGLTGPTTPLERVTVRGQRFDYQPVAAGMQTVAICPWQEDNGVQGAEANARLIAAAPELLEALKDARQNGLIYWEPNTTRGDVALKMMLKRIDDVLAKATGQ